MPFGRMYPSYASLGVRFDPFPEPPMPRSDCQIAPLHFLVQAGVAAIRWDAHDG
jgi:hypothetical protein